MVSDGLSHRLVLEVSLKEPHVRTRMESGESASSLARERLLCVEECSVKQGHREFTHYSRGGQTKAPGATCGPTKASSKSQIRKVVTGSLRCFFQAIVHQARFYVTSDAHFEG